jgi:Spy/CpxP family protein refolding chaperone
MKRILSIVGIFLTVGIVSISLFANDSAWGRGRGGGGYWGGPGSCWGYNQGYGRGELTQEQEARLDELYQSFYDETALIKNDLWAKRAQMRTLMGVSQIDKEKVQALQREINDLRSTLAEKRLDMMLKAREIAPDFRLAGRFGRGQGSSKGGHSPHRRGYGPHMRGGYGPGMQGGYGGYGPGACWQ